MDSSQLPDVSSLLVTEDNPARADLSGTDHERCAALHNYLVYYAWIFQGRSPATLLSSSKKYFTTYGAAAEALRPRLHPSVAAFLDAALLPVTETPEPFFLWAAAIPEPEELFDNYATHIFSEPEDSLGGKAGAGLYYHQECHQAVVFMSMIDFNFALPFREEPDLWHPLETIFSNWIELIHLGKIVASPTEAPSLFGSEKIGPWEWRPYSEAQVVTCIGAWDRLCNTIEGRISLLSPTNATVNRVEPEPLLTPDILDAALVPERCFARDFLTIASRPNFRYIAPGPAPPTHERIIPPVCIFTTRRGECEADLTMFSNAFLARSYDSAVLLRGPAGVYTELLDRYTYFESEEGFRLLIPYELEGDEWALISGARMSDGTSVVGGTTFELFQHGYKAFGGHYHRAQRLERLFDHWKKLVGDGVWSVGTDGVEGTIDTLKDADTTH
ncbi:chitin-type 1 protein [Rutstroemia sp. NJR-2017a WRK4]|nr:chitin-type 1 protein [Rutstroemia sp. NJR-2017a WRK4]